MEFALFLWHAAQVLVGYNLILPVILVLSYSLYKRESQKRARPDYADYAIVVTAYRYTDSLPSVVASLLKLHYSNYHIYIVADNCADDNLSFHDERVSVLQPDTVLASNTRSHFYAIERFRRDHDRIAIIDSDNLVDPEFLNELNVYFDRGFRAVQGLRQPLNLDTTLACLDAARDIYYHFYDGKVLFGLGSSATLSGSGMAFAVPLYRECLEKLNIDGAGFDKVLQAQIVMRDHRIAFAEKAVVLDAKTSKADELVNQRSRWIGTWFTYCGYSVRLLASGLKSLSINKILFGLILLRPPLFIFLLLSTIFWIINFFSNPTGEWAWAIGMALFIAGFGIALVSSRTDRRIYKAFIHIPKFMFLQVLALTKFLGRSEGSVSTKHSFTIKNEK